MNRVFTIALILVTLTFTSKAQKNIVYPRITGYVGIVHPIVTYSEEGTVKNFDGHYTVGMPTGINIWKNEKVGFSFEITPFIKTEDGKSKMNNLSFHPGVLLALGHGFTFAGRTAFETSGRFGLTPVISKIIKKNKGSNFYVALMGPARFGNDAPASVTVGIQVGVGF